MSRKAKVGDGLLSRGVWVAPWMGPKDELVLLAMRSDGKLATDAPTIVPNGASRIDAADRLWDIVEQQDPDRLRTLRVI